MHCGVMVTGYNQGDWDRLMTEDYDRPPTVPDHVNMDDTLYLGELVEPLGFDSIWATEHYGSAYSMQPNPLQWLAYWAGRTTRVDVGTAVIVAPWWNPVRLAHEISMLDILLKGRRLHLGIGRGVAPHEYASLGIPIEESHTYFYDVVNAIRAADGKERFTFDGAVYKIPPTSIRPQARHKGDLTTNIKAAFSTEKSARLAAENGLGQMFVSGDDLDSMTAGVTRFNQIRAELGLPPDQPTTLLWMYCAETSAEAEEGWEYFHNQLTAAQHHYFEWNNPGFEGINGYEEYLLRQAADVGVADAALASRRATQPIGTPDEIIDKIKTLQGAISLETLVIHDFYGGMPREKAERSLRLFAEKVLPAVQAMDTPINPASLGRAPS
ncbi:MAG TPA: LLM class flavin-dependent oxidoreductase [Acidimicrobiales bacterium]|nr:LLM class flavin-dependent oxidoreductase [Acidimicrobiales bacterium]